MSHSSTNIILDYSETLNLGSFARAQADGGYGREDERKAFDRGSGCYCKTPLEQVFCTKDFPELEGWDYDNTWWIRGCPRCGFWTLSTYAWCDTATISYMRSENEACLRKFDVSAIDVPTQTLRDYLSKNETKFHKVDPKKFEKLVGSIFRDFYNCKALHMGRSGDGGIDLIVLDSDSPLAIQVKRRSDIAAKESVSTVREFLGATLLQGFHRGAIVTTAGAFTKASTLAAQEAKDRLLVKQFDLIDFNRFLHIFRLVTPRDAELPWMRQVPNTFKQAIETKRIDILAKQSAYHEWERIGRPFLSVDQQRFMYFEALTRIQQPRPQPSTLSFLTENTSEQIKKDKRALSREARKKRTSARDQ